MSARGYILVECLVAMAVLSISMVTIHNALRQAVLTHAQARDMTEARFLLDQKMGEYRLKPTLYEGEDSGDFGAAFPRFKWEVAVSKVELPKPALPQPRNPQEARVPKLPVRFMGRIDVTVRWTTAGRPFDEQLQTLIEGKRVKTLNPPDASTSPT